jgi:hypothetical protein
VLCVLTCLLTAGTASAASIVINPAPGLAGNAAALAAFNRAASKWGGLFGDPITVTVDADLLNMGSPTILGSTSAVFLAGGYTTIRNRMVADAADEPGDAVVASLPTSAQFSTFVPAGFGLAGMAATKANLKAMGFPGLDVAFGATDATVQFNSGFSFDFDNSDGVTAGTYDFETVAIHELGHVPGFVSAVDDVDWFLEQGQTANLYIEPLDLFRFGPIGH